MIHPPIPNVTPLSEAAVRAACDPHGLTLSAKDVEALAYGGALIGRLIAHVRAFPLDAATDPAARFHADPEATR
jgi:hypothetical protein